MWPRSGVLDFSKKPRGAKKGEIPFVRSRMSTCFRRNFQISGFSGETGFSLISRSKNQKTPDFSGSFKSNERKLRPVKISAQSDENWRFFITSKVSASETASASETQKQARSYRNAKATNLLKSQLNRTTDSRVIRKFVKSVGCPHSSHTTESLLSCSPPSIKI